MEELQTFIDGAHDIRLSVNGGPDYSVKSGYQIPFVAVPGAGPDWTWDHDGDGPGDGNGNGIGDWNGPVLFFRHQESGLSAGSYAFEFTVIYEDGTSYFDTILVEVVAP